MMFWRQASTIAGREYLSTVRRKAFLFTALGTPAYFALVMFMSIGPSASERTAALKEFTSLGVVDSSGLFVHAPREISTDLAQEAIKLGGAVPTQIVRTEVRHFTGLATAEAALRAGEVSQVLVIPADYLERGSLRRYARSFNLFTSADRRPIATWLVQGLVGGQLDSNRVARVARPTIGMDLYALNKQGTFELKDDKREVVDFLLPFAFAMLLGLSITLGGQYLLQGVSEEKESRILESLLCNVSPTELLAGKLIGLGSAGLTLVGIWLGFAIPLLGSGLLVSGISVPAGVLLAAFLYFLLGYLFYGSIMTGIGSMASSMREAQQFSVWLSFLNFAPFLAMTIILGRPDGPVAVGMSLFPPTAPVAMMLRLMAPSGSVPLWQVALSLLLLVGAAWLALTASARVFRIGLLMYGKSPTLSEILCWARQG
jgi:ABC-2 type transport system permease protein